MPVGVVAKSVLVLVARLVTTADAGSVAVTTAPAASAPGAFTLPALPYSESALEPHIDELTMQLHHGRHHAAYVAGLNLATMGRPPVPLEDLLATAADAGAAIRNMGGGHYNHALFWINMAPAGAGGEPSAALAKAIDRDFGSFEAMKERLAKAAATQFGSGWAWLGPLREGSSPSAPGTLVVTSTANQDNPLMKGLEYHVEDIIPILGLDVWEHAYYLKYQNQRPEYISAFWNVVNWAQVSRNYEEYAVHRVPVPPLSANGTKAASADRADEPCAGGNHSQGFENKLRKLIEARKSNAANDAAVVLAAASGRVTLGRAA